MSSIDWSVLNSAHGCECQLQIFHDLVKNGLDTITPLRTMERGLLRIYGENGKIYIFVLVCLCNKFSLFTNYDCVLVKLLGLCIEDQWIKVLSLN